MDPNDICQCWGLGDLLMDENECCGYCAAEKEKQAALAANVEQEGIENDPED